MWGGLCPHPAKKEPGHLSLDFDAGPNPKPHTVSFNLTCDSREKMAGRSCLDLGHGHQPQVCMCVGGAGVKETRKRIHTSPTLILEPRESEARSPTPDGSAQDRHNLCVSLPSLPSKHPRPRGWGDKSVLPSSSDSQSPSSRC